MKNRIKLLLALSAAVLSVAITAHQSSAGITSLGRMKWNRGISSYGLGSTDSTRISIPGAGGSIDCSDTTRWVDMNVVGLTQAYTEQCMLAFQINGQLGSGTDSVGWQVQFTNDPVSETQSIAAGNNNNIFTAAFASVNKVTAATQGIATGTDGTITIVCAVKPKTAATSGTALDFPYRFVRLIVRNAMVATNRQYFTVDAVVFGSPR